jgi:hypothetical protein
MWPDEKTHTGIDRLQFHFISHPVAQHHDVRVGVAAATLTAAHDFYSLVVDARFGELFG